MNTTWYKTAQELQTISPVYHGSVFSFKPEDIRPDRNGIIFFTESEQFAEDYARQKSFEAQMDADIEVHAYTLEGKVYDPYDAAQSRQLAENMTEPITVYNDFGMPADLSKEEWLELVSGRITYHPMFSDEDLAGKRPGDGLPDNRNWQKTEYYELLRIEPDVVYYMSYRGVIQNIMEGRYCPNYRKDEVPENMTAEEIAEDIINLDRPTLTEKYCLWGANLHPRPLKATRHSETTEGNDVWRWLEGDQVMETAKKLGYSIVRSKEGGHVTYAALPGAKITPIKDWTWPPPPLKMPSDR
jgi:hypothetical protein